MWESCKIKGGGEELAHLSLQPCFPLPPSFPRRFPRNFPTFSLTCLHPISTPKFLCCLSSRTFPLLPWVGAHLGPQNTLDASSCPTSSWPPYSWIWHRSSKGHSRMFPGSWNNSTVSKVLALYVANLDLIAGIFYGPPSTTINDSLVQSPE